MAIPFEETYDQFMADPERFLTGALHIVGIFIAGAVVWWLISLIIRRVEDRFKDRPFFSTSDRFFHLLRRAGHYAVYLFVGMALINLIQSDLLNRIFGAFMIMLLSSIACSIVNSLIPYLERNLAARTDTHMDDVIVDLTKKFSGIAIYVAGAIMAMDRLGLNVMPFVAGAGVAGIAIGFAAKDTLSNLISGILLIIDRPLKVGDRIELWSAPKNSASWGDVVDIGLRATKIKTTDNIVVIIPNNILMNRDIVNYTAISEEIRVRIPIGISYEADTRKAKDLIIQVSLELEWVMKDPGPKVVVKNFGESSVDLEARVWIRDPRKRMDTISYITDRVKEVFDQEKIEIPYPKRDITIRREIAFTPVSSPEKV
ncbi:MAG: mechanosensitive ion channel family protein [Deltaproteobacteria bacterium]|nr:mechanosensitive ion channel family protein [Deltaproteobacteria bacterium]